MGLMAAQSSRKMEETETVGIVLGYIRTQVQKMYSWPLNNTGMNHTGPLVLRFLSLNAY